MVHKLLIYIHNLIPLAKTVLWGGMGIVSAMLFSAFLMTVFSADSCEGYLIYLAARQVCGLAFVVFVETAVCTFLIHSYAANYEN